MQVPPGGSPWKATLAPPGGQPKSDHQKAPLISGTVHDGAISFLFVLIANQMALPNLMVVSS